VTIAAKNLGAHFINASPSTGSDGPQEMLDKDQQPFPLHLTITGALLKVQSMISLELAHHKGNFLKIYHYKTVHVWRIFYTCPKLDAIKFELIIYVVYMVTIRRIKRQSVLPPK
jgi:hypothetical protein